MFGCRGYVKTMSPKSADPADPTPPPVPPKPFPDEEPSFGEEGGGADKESLDDDGDEDTWRLKS